MIINGVMVRRSGMVGRVCIFEYFREEWVINKRGPWVILTKEELYRRARVHDSSLLTLQLKLLQLAPLGVGGVAGIR
jgi:hypothetical protein